MGAFGEIISATYQSNVNNAASVAVDLSRIRDILDICSPSLLESSPTTGAVTAPLTATTNGTNSSRWVRLSRRPSVDQPDESGLPAPDESQPEPQAAAMSYPASMHETAVHVAPPGQGPAAAFERPGFPADLFFNGISQDASSWWEAFETYDPDCPSWKV